MNIFINVLCLVLLFLLGYGIGFPDGERAQSRKVTGARFKAMEKAARDGDRHPRPRNPGDGFEGPGSKISTAPAPGHKEAARMVLRLMEVHRREGWPYLPVGLSEEERDGIKGGITTNESTLQDQVDD